MARRKYKMPFVAQVIGLLYAIGQATRRNNLDDARLKEISARTTNTDVRTQKELIVIQEKQAAILLKRAQAAEAQAKAEYYQEMKRLGKLIDDGERPKGQKMLQCPKCKDYVVPTTGALICDQCHVHLVETYLDMSLIK